MLCEDVLFIRIKKYESYKFAIMEHGHGVTGSIALSSNTLGVFMFTVIKGDQVINDTWFAFFKNFL